MLYTFDVHEYQEVTEQLISHFEYFNDWRSNNKIQPILGVKINNDPRLSAFFSSLADESTLALFLIYTDVSLMRK